MSSFNAIIDRLKSDLVTLTSLPVYISTDSDVETPPSSAYINIVLDSFGIQPSMSQLSGLLVITSDLKIILVNQAGQDVAQRVDFDLVGFITQMEVILIGLHLWYPCDGDALLVEPATYSQISKLERKLEQYIQAAITMNVTYEL